MFISVVFFKIKFMINKLEKRLEDRPVHVPLKEKSSFTLLQKMLQILPDTDTAL